MKGGTLFLHRASGGGGPSPPAAMVEGASPQARRPCQRPLRPPAAPGATSPRARWRSGSGRQPPFAAAQIALSYTPHPRIGSRPCARAMSNPPPMPPRSTAVERPNLTPLMLFNLSTSAPPAGPTLLRHAGLVPASTSPQLRPSEVPALRERRMCAPFVIPGLTRDPRCRAPLPLRRSGPRLKARVTKQKLGRRILSRAGRRRSLLRRIPVARWCAGVAWSSPRGLLQTHRGRIPAEHRASASTCSTCPPAPGGSV
jgi:hypothetical protein